VNIHPDLEDTMLFKDTFFDGLCMIFNQYAKSSLKHLIGFGLGIEILKGSKRRIMALFKRDFILVEYRKE
jgi:hypothetical protein